MRSDGEARNRNCTLRRQHLNIGKGCAMRAVRGVDAPGSMCLHGRHQQTIKDMLSRDLWMLLQERQDPLDDILAGIHLDNCGGPGDTSPFPYELYSCSSVILSPI